MSKLIAKEYQGFEQIKHTDENGNEYWFARKLAFKLGIASRYVEQRGEGAMGGQMTHRLKYNLEIYCI